MEPAYKELIPLVETLSQAIQPLLDRPYAFFGHSFGALAAFELTRDLRRRGLPQPVMLFASACGAPHIPDPQPPIHTLPNAQFLEALNKFNGVSPELLRQPAVMDLFLPALRADCQAFETYSYAPEPPLNCRISAFGGTNDPRFSREGLEAGQCKQTLHFNHNIFPAITSSSTLRESLSSHPSMQR